MNPVTATTAIPLESKHNIDVTTVKNDIKCFIGRYEDVEDEYPQFFTDIIYDIIPHVLRTEEELVMSRYKNVQEYYAGDILDKLKHSKPIKFTRCLKEIQQEIFSSNVCIQIKHLKVFQQQRGSACGFHMMWNAKCLVRALLAEKKFDQLKHLALLASGPHFFRHVIYITDLLKKCSNKFFVSD